MDTWLHHLNYAQVNNPLTLSPYPWCHQVISFPFITFISTTCTQIQPTQNSVLWKKFTWAQQGIQIVVPLITNPSSPHRHMSPRSIWKKDRPRSMIKPPSGSHHCLMSKLILFPSTKPSLINLKDSGPGMSTAYGTSPLKVARGSSTRCTVLIIHQWGPPGSHHQTHRKVPKLPAFPWFSVVSNGLYVESKDMSTYYPIYRVFIVQKWILKTQTEVI